LTSKNSPPILSRVESNTLSKKQTNPEHLRPILNQTYLMMLERYGMVEAIVNAFNEETKN
jgi:hypothetical protein